MTYDRTKPVWPRSWCHDVDVEPTEEQKKETQEIQDRVDRAVDECEAAGLAAGDELIPGSGQ
jgi:hypothetical protein